MRYRNNYRIRGCQGYPLSELNRRNAIRSKMVVNETQQHIPSLELLENVRLIIQRNLKLLRYTLNFNI